MTFSVNALPKDHSFLNCLIYPHPKGKVHWSIFLSLTNVPNLPALKFSSIYPPLIHPFLYTNFFHLLFILVFLEMTLHRICFLGSFHRFWRETRLTQILTLSSVLLHLKFITYIPGSWENRHSSDTELRFKL